MNRGADRSASSSTRRSKHSRLGPNPPTAIRRGGNGAGDEARTRDMQLGTRTGRLRVRHGRREPDSSTSHRRERLWPRGWCRPWGDDIRDRLVVDRMGRVTRVKGHLSPVDADRRAPQGRGPSRFDWRPPAGQPPTAEAAVDQPDDDRETSVHHPSSGPRGTTVTRTTTGSPPAAVSEPSSRLMTSRRRRYSPAWAGAVRRAKRARSCRDRDPPSPRPRLLRQTVWTYRVGPNVRRVVPSDADG